MNTPTVRKTIRADELAEQLGRSRNWIYAQCKLGNIPGAIKVGKAWLIPINAADQMLSRSQ